MSHHEGEYSAYVSASMLLRQESGTCSFEAAVTYCYAGSAPFWQFTALSSCTYSVPGLAMEPTMSCCPSADKTRGPLRWFSFVSARRVIMCNVLETSISESTFRKGDCRKETLRAVFNASSRT